MLSFFKRKQEDYELETNDYLIVFDNDKKISDIKRIDAITEEAIICTGYYKVPIEDCEITTGAEGRNFFYRAPTQSVMETQRLARLEQNLVLSQITAYEPPQLPGSFDWTKGLLFGLVFVAFIVIGFAV